MMSLNCLDLTSRTRRHHNDFLTGFHPACLDSSYRNGSDTGNRVYVLYRDSQRLTHWLFWWVQNVKCLSKGRSLVPCHVLRFFNQVVTLPTRYWDKVNLGGIVSYQLEHLFDGFFGLLVT